MFNDKVQLILVDRYIKIRQESLNDHNSYKMTVRHLRSMIKLSDVLAKLHCDTEARESYVDEAYGIISSGVVAIKGEDIEIMPQNTEEVKLTFDSKDSLRIAIQLVYLIGTREGPMKDDLVSCYLEQIEESLETEEQFYNEKSLVEGVIDFLVAQEGVLFITENNIYIQPDCDI